MITAEKKISLPDTYPLKRLGQLEELLFFDIETTGFSGSSSRLYLIGCTCFRGGEWRLIQWFADRPESEVELLGSFFDFLKNFTTIVHFNGDGFDIPYLLKRCEACGLPYDFSGITSIDIYKRIRPYRRLLALENLKQKSIEHFLGIFREDPYTGGQLIEVYQKYLATHDQRLYDMLMLHNFEDLEGMPLILPILNYPDFLEHDFTFAGQSVSPGMSDTASAPVRASEAAPLQLTEAAPLQLTLRAESPFSVPAAIQWTAACGPHRWHFSAEGCFLTLTTDLFAGTLKHFYPDYQNYYYLPFEDTAIHKSVGEYVEKTARQKATRQTCFTKKEAVFLPQPESVWEPEFKRGCKDSFSYTEYNPELLKDSQKLNAYLRSLLKLSENI